MSIEEVDPSKPPCEIKPLKASENESASKSAITSDKTDEITRRYSPVDSPGPEGGIDFFVDSGDEYTDSIFEIAR